MRPAVKLSDDLVVADAAGDDGLNHLVWRHARHTEVGSAAETVLAGVLAAHSVVDLLGAQS